jgi:hypothetical protein
LKGGYTAWKDAGFPISYQKDGITYMKGPSVLDLFDPIKVELGKVLTIEGYLNQSMNITPPYKPLYMHYIRFIGLNDTNQVTFRYIKLKNFPNDEILTENILARVRGKIVEVSDGNGDMEVDNVEFTRKTTYVIDTVDSHWKDLGAELLRETNSSMIDNASVDLCFNQKTSEVVVCHTVGNMEPFFQGDRIYEPKVMAYYFVNLDGNINRIYLEYRQLR